MITPLAKKSFYIYTILASALIPIACSVFLFIAYRDWRWENEHVHAGIELLGSFAALSLAAIFLLLEKPPEDTAHHLWVACSMISMGIMDLFHVLSRQLNLFVWLHSLSELTGGILFALVWVPSRAIGPKLFGVIPWVVTGTVTAGVVFTLQLLQIKQLMLEGDAFTSPAKLINLLGGGFFLLAAIRLSVLYHRGKRPDDLLLTNLCILFGITGLLFSLSSLWSAVWWFWHFVRMVAYFLILGYLFFSYKRATEDLLEAKVNLEKKVLERTKELAIANQSLQAELTERKRAELEYKTILRTAMDGFYIVDTKGRIQDANDSYCSLIGYTLDELLNMRLKDIEAMETERLVAEHMRQIIEVGWDRFETRHKCKDGRIVEIEANVNYMKEGTGRFLVFMRDITERKRAEEALKKSENLLKETQQITKVGGWEYDIENNKKTWTDECYRIHELSSDYDPNNIQRDIEFYAPDARKAIETAFYNAITKGEPYDLVLPFITAKGNHLWVRTIGKVEFRDGRPVRVFGNIMDITETRKAEELQKTNIKLKEIDQLKSMFIASMSHELRTPLNSVIGFSSVLMNEWPGPVNPEQRKLLKTILYSGKHLLALINDVIDVSKIEAGSLDINLEDFDLDEVIHETTEIIKKELTDKKLDIKAETPHLMMHSDKRRLMQCVLNLLSNAIKFTPKGNIRIETKMSGDFVEISVADTGIGILEEDIPKLCKAFVRLDSPLRATTLGTGLGLYITKKLITETLQGEIRIESTCGQGSTFTLRAPINITTSDLLIPKR